MYSALNRVKKPQNLFLLLGTFFIGTMIFLMPIKQVPDEGIHALTAWCTFYTSEDGAIQNSFAASPDTYDKKSFTEKIDLSKEKFKFNLTKKNLQYLPQAIGMMIGKLIYPSIGTIFIFGRIINSLFYLISLFFIIKWCKFGQNLMVFLALLPIMIQQAASLSYDVVNFIAIMNFFSLLTNLLSVKIIDKKYAILTILSIIFLYITKFNNILLISLLLFLPFHFSKKHEKINRALDNFKRFVEKYKFLLLSVTIVLIIASSQIFLASRGGLINFLHVLFNTLFNNNLNGYLNDVLTIGIFGYFGYFKIQLPLWLVFIDVIAIFILSFEETDIKIPKYFGILSGLMFPIQVLTIISGMYFLWTYRDLGEGAIISTGAQGRYFTPFLVFLSPYFLSIRDTIDIKTKKQFNLSLLVVLLLFNFIVMCYLIYFVYWN